MLDSETKRRIDTARDILVGKVPDPKSQVEQITIALIYKFMDDMDAEAEELGGKRSFFVGEYEKFGWAKLMSPALGGFEVLNLYTEAIDKMTRNEGVPQLFRDIFKNAYLPYRDPETLKLFLKTINEFTYDHSEKLGDAFEYLLSVLGSQGDAGQFRTPRHIIEFMVKVVDPQKEESILDPACGTAGFLISAYKHVMNANAKNGKPGGALKPAERAKLAEHIRGYDISPDMVRLSLVNLYLHGFNTPHIYEYDSLTSEERWTETADVILANPPFMSPKGGIKPHKRFSVQSNRSEVLFVDYMAEHLTPNGRAAIIVPEGIIFQSAGAYKQLRKYLVEQNYLWAVVSLPAGVFNPYAGVKTSILFLDKSLAKKTDQILFVKVEADGFDLGAQRRQIDRNDLPDALNSLHAWHKAVLDGQAASFHPKIDSALLVSTSRLAENDDYNLSADRYREVKRHQKSNIQMMKLGDLCTFMTGGTPTSTISEYYENGNIPWLVSGDIHQGEIFDCEGRITETGVENSNAKYLPKDSVLIALNGQGKTRGTVALLRMTGATCNQSLVSINPIDNSKLLPEFLYHQLRSMYQQIRDLTGDTQRSGLNIPILKTIQIPLPPLEIQRQIVDEIAAHQRIIDGARQVVDGWKPSIEIDPNWEIVGLDTVCDIQRGKFSHRPRNEPRFYGGKYPFIQTGDIVRADGGKITYTQTLNDEGLSISKLFQPPLVVITIAANIGDTAVLDFPCCFPDSVVGLTPKHHIDVHFLELMMRTQKQYLNDIAPQAAQKNINIEILKTVKIPLPPLEVQREIVARIEKERAIVEGNRELIRLYEEKVKKVIERVWEG